MDGNPIFLMIYLIQILNVKIRPLMDGNKKPKKPMPMKPVKIRSLMDGNTTRG